MTVDHKAFLARLEGELPDMPAALEPQQTGTELETRATEANGKSALGTRLEGVSGKAVDKLEEIMAIPLDPAQSQFPSLLRAQTAAANTALTVQSRVDETSLRRASVDRLPELLKLVEEVRKTLPRPPPQIDGGENES
jgi:hypothetical protein